MTIVLKYTTADGSQKQVEFEDDVNRISLRSKKISNIDLKPLASCANLQLLSLGFNQLQTIDLSPLASCSNLRYLELRGNILQNIDLSPLASCPNLFDFDLTNNRLHSIDLCPLASCVSLRSLGLGGNYPQSFDLSPLALCKDISFTNLSSNSSYSWLKVLLHEDEEGTPLKFEYKRPERSYPWSFLYKVLKEFGEDCRVQQDIIHTLGFGYFGFVDCNLRDFFLSFPPDSPLESVRKQVRDKLIHQIITAADKGGSTTGLKLEELLMHGDVAKRTQKIIEAREVEIRNVGVVVSGTKVDLRELYLTHYGYEVLTALSLHLTTDLEGLEQVKKSLSELGFELIIDAPSIFGLQMSDELKEAIWWIAENRGRPWSEIEGK